MQSPPTRQSLMKFLLTNDDGIAAPGMEALFAAIRYCFGSDAEVIVVAPDRARSECGHSITSGRPLRLQEVRPGWFSLDGTPVDCVRAALSLPLAADADFVFSGVNSGANLGIDLLVSGTFAAAREASLQGRPAMACSHYRRPDVPKTWDHVGRWMSPILEEFVQTAGQNAKQESVSEPNGKAKLDGGESPCPGVLWNVNLPAINPDALAPAKVVCPVDRCPMQRTAFDRPSVSRSSQLQRLTDEPQTRTSLVELQSDFHGRPREAGTDVDLCFSGSLTISKVLPHLF